jgi:hypothetical protein
MNTGQMLLTIGAMGLLATIMLRVNTMNLSTDTIRSEAQYGVLATSIATSIIEEAKSKAFDEATVAGKVDNLNALSTTLGKESGETFATFDDIDDFNNYTATDSSMPSAVFNINCKVAYVDLPNINVDYGSPTWNKKITVKVSSPSMDDTLTISSIYSYWYFR